MLDRKFIVENADRVRQNCEQRGVKCDVDKLVELETARRQRQVEAEELNRKANEVSKSIGATKDPTERDARKEEGRKLREEVQAAQADLEKITAEADAVLRQSSASIGDVLTQERTQALPLIGANVLDLMQVMPGMKTGNFTAIGAFDTDTFTGQYANTVNVTRNGMSVNSGRNDPNIFGLQSTVNINPDLVGEIRLILSPVDPVIRLATVGPEVRNDTLLVSCESAVQLFRKSA